VAEPASTYRLADKARVDLERLGRWMARESGVQRAEAVLKGLEERFRLAASLPLVGHRRDDLGKGLRCLTMRPYLIVYRPQSFGIEIVRVIDGRRDLETLFDNET
jgi:toxin ParE1/3/4